jgi:site-specific DNA-methyltransferase (adenine-specific)
MHRVEKSRLVVDPFLGIGNKELASLELGVAFVGFEIDASYYSEARRAIQRARKT